MRQILVWVCAVAGAVASPLFAGDPPQGSEVPDFRQILDRPLRQVNAELLTWSDVYANYYELLGQGRLPPRTNQERDEIFSAILDKLTATMLLKQEAKRLGVQVDEGRITRFVIEESRSSGRGQDLIAQSVRRKNIENEQFAELAVSYYSERVPAPGPDAAEKYYVSNLSQFERPARASGHMIMVRPSSVQDIAEVEKAEVSLIKAARGLNDELLRAEGMRAVAAWTAADATVERNRASLALLMDVLLSATAAESVGAKDKAVIALARSLRQAQLLIRSPAECLEYAVAIAERLRQAGPEQRAVMAAVYARSNPGTPMSADGGRFERTEPGKWGSAFDAQVMSSTTGATVGPYQVGDNWWVVQVSELEPARRFRFDEKRAEIEALLARLHEIEVRRQVVRLLRSRAQVVERGSFSEFFP